MTTDKPTLTLAEVCNLTEAERESRVTRFRRDLLPRATFTEGLPDGRAWEFVREPELERQLEELVTFERGCCPALGWELRRVRGGSALRLEVIGINPTPSLSSNTTPRAEQPPRGRLAAIAGVVGVAVSVSLLCALPIVMAAGGAAALADFVAGLDDPRLIGAVALVAGLVAWRVLYHRAARQSERAKTGCGC